MTALCPASRSTMAAPENSLPSFEGIDPPLLDPLMVEHFNNQSQEEERGSPSKTGGGSDGNLQSLSLDDLIKIAAQLCETDPSFSEQILSALSADQGSQSPAPDSDPPVSQPMDSEEPEQALPDTNSILNTLNQSLLLQEYNNTLALQLAQVSSRLAKVSSGQASTTAASPPSSSAVLLNSESLQEAMKSNLFIMEKQASNFVPLTEYHKNKPRPKYTRKNFSPEQIDGLEAAFQEHRFVKKDLRRELAKKLNLSERSISYWFQNKRARSKPPITMSSEAALKAAAVKPGQAELEQQEQGLPITAESLASAIQDIQQNLQQSCAT